VRRRELFLPHNTSKHFSRPPKYIHTLNGGEYVSSSMETRIRAPKRHDKHKKKRELSQTIQASTFLVRKKFPKANYIHTLSVAVNIYPAVWGRRYEHRGYTIRRELFQTMQALFSSAKLLSKAYTLSTANMSNLPRPHLPSLQTSLRLLKPSPISHCPSTTTKTPHHPRLPQSR
jgi:hypothetical protein